MTRSARVSSTLAAALAVVATTASPGASAQAAPRLEGKWRVSIVYKVAQGLQDRRVGQRFEETWTFQPRCNRGACNVVLRRDQRSLLLRRSGVSYTGRRSFAGTFLCNGRSYPSGTTYVESWTVRIRRSGPGPRGRRAVAIGGVGATVGRSSRNLPCAQVVSLEGVEFGGTPLRR